MILSLSPLVMQMCIFMNMHILNEIRVLYSGHLTHEKLSQDKTFTYAIFTLKGKLS